MRIHLLLSLSLLGLTLACQEDAESPTAPDLRPALATTASTLVFAQVSAGVSHTCGVTTDNRVYCWGYGVLGDGATSTTTRRVPVAVGGALRFRQVSAGGPNTCAISTDNRAYCWGYNDFGAIGDGTTTTRLTPAPVIGGHLFRTVQTGGGHTCAVTASDDRAFCWGYNAYGQLGIGNNTGPEGTSTFDFHSTKPVAVTGGLTFRQVNPGDYHTCGVTTDNRAFCWGRNLNGAVGDSSTSALRVRPTRVAGGRQYRQIDAGLDFSCAVTTGNRAFCWGSGAFGQLGNGVAKNVRYPRAVSGGLSIARVSTGQLHACATTTGNRANCWGYAWSYGTLGDGTLNRSSLTPVAVAGGLFFDQVTAGDQHTCAKTSTGKAYCWGGPGDELGTGGFESSSVPVAVVGPM